MTENSVLVVSRLVDSDDDYLSGDSEELADAIMNALSDGGDSNDENGSNNDNEDGDNDDGGSNGSWEDISVGEENL